MSKAYLINTTRSSELSGQRVEWFKGEGNKSCQVDGTMTLQDTHSDVREQCLIKWSHNMAKLALLPEDIKQVLARICW